MRSMLFVPADNERKLIRAAGSGADALILDLEDSVAANRKPIAREAVTEYLSVHRDDVPQLWVRINSLREGGLDDLVAIVHAAPAGVVVPKVAHPRDLRVIGTILDALERRDGVEEPIQLIAVATETPLAPFNLRSYARGVVPRLLGLTWGAEDLSAALGASTNRDQEGNYAFTYRMVRSLCLLAAKASGVAAIETIHPDFNDDEGLRRGSRAAAAEGFSARLAIHPAQVPIINEAFTPSIADIKHAREVIAAFGDAGVVSLNGSMLDQPHLKQALTILARAEEATE